MAQLDGELRHRSRLLFFFFANWAGADSGCLAAAVAAAVAVVGQPGDDWGRLKERIGVKNGRD